MNILLYNGALSRRNTYEVVHTYKKLCEERGHNVTLIDEDLKDCFNCRQCYDTGRCIIEDKLTKALLHNDYDVIVIGSPIYFYYLSAKAKSFLDRLYCVEKMDKIFSILAVSGSPVNMSGLDVIEESIMRSADYCGFYVTKSFCKVTNDQYVGILEEDISNLLSIIEETEEMYNEIKKGC